MFFLCISKHDGIYKWWLLKVPILNRPWLWKGLEHGSPGGQGEREAPLGGMRCKLFWVRGNGDGFWVLLLKLGHLFVGLFVSLLVPERFFLHVFTVFVCGNFAFHDLSVWSVWCYEQPHPIFAATWTSHENMASFDAETPHCIRIFTNPDCC